ncbi:MAG: hypothetical protein E6J41_01435 [Chloroflexi bacterium]|nr:MAG: hypothetical protein E6J41_01435 [Chloroflexota bacterium]
MAERVLTTDQAVRAAKAMQQLLDGHLVTNLQAVRASGSALSNPAVWDGPAARDFRTTWPGTRAALDQALTQVQAMQSQAVQVTRAIELAGTQGALGGGGSSPARLLNLGPALYDASHLALQSYYRAAQATWNRPSTLLDHFQRHWSDVWAASREEYATAATRFLQDAQAAGYDVKIAGNTLRVWDPATRTFAAYSLDGKTRTIFKPDPARFPGDSYWQNPSFGHTPTGTELADATADAARTVDGAVTTPFARVGQLLDSPLGRTASKGLAVLGAAGDIFTIADPSPNALGGANTERWAAAANLGAMAVTAGPVAGLLAANAATDWIPVVGEVTMAATAAYFVGDLIYQNREAIGHAFSTAEHAVVNVASSVGHDIGSGLSHAWHGLFG